MLSFIDLIVVALTIGGPSSYRATGNVLRYFFIGAIFNAIRILALGIAIRYGYYKDSGGVG